MNYPLSGRASTRLLARASLIAALLGSAQAWAGYGVYLNGYGMQSSGAGGVGFSLAQDSYSIAANPALAGVVGPRVDFGLEWNEVDPSVRIHDNANGPDQVYKSRKTHFPIPQAGIVIALSDRLSAGFTGFVAGLGSDYPRSPLERFGGPSSTTLSLAQGGVTSVLAYRLDPHQHVGASFNLSYQGLNFEGGQAFVALSESPEQVTNQGTDDLMGVGFTLGYHARWTPWLQAGISYRSKTWTQRAREYAGLLPDQGSFDLPAVYGLGLALTPAASWTLAADYQRDVRPRECDRQSHRATDRVQSAHRL